MHIDWIVSITIFLVAIAYAFSYYVSFFDTGLEADPDAAFEAIMKELKTEVIETPAIFETSEPEGFRLIYSPFPFEAPQEDIRVHDSEGKKLGCMLAGGRLYWLANTSIGRNRYRVSFANGTAGGCSSFFQAANESLASLMLQERGMEFSREKIERLMASGYESLKKSLGLPDFRLELEAGGSRSSYGQALPGNRNIFSRESKGRVYETGEKVSLRMMVW
ncbi:MAG: hypothetical protein HYX24_04730 [Candidatus Aenigmarchaeota archaeon]|nr:hypothetical protein [Candidatus Aenigmarchaeota archaeon]